MSSAEQRVGKLSVTEAVRAKRALPRYCRRTTSMARECRVSKHRIIEHKIAGWRGDDLLTDIFSDQAGRNMIVGKVAVEGVVAEPLGVIGNVRQGIVDLATDQILAVVQPAE